MFSGEIHVDPNTRDALELHAVVLEAHRIPTPGAASDLMDWDTFALAQVTEVETEAFSEPS
jgi:hypothetical protein